MNASGLLQLEEGHLRFLSALASASLPASDQLSIAAMREAAAAVRKPWCAGGASMHETVDRFVTVPSGRLNVRLYFPTAARPLPMLIYLHGGGWTLLDLDTHDRIMREFAAATRWAVVGVDFPQAPETPFPGAIEACLVVLHTLRLVAREWGLAPLPFALAGDSSGANLALALAIELHNRGEKTPDALVLSYGVYDCDLDRATYRTYGAPPFTLSAERMAFFWANYCPDAAKRRDPLASPLRADLRGLPPIHLIVAGQDVLRDENLALAARLIECGNALSLDSYPRAPHGFLEALALDPSGEAAIRRASCWLNDVSTGLK